MVDVFSICGTFSLPIAEKSEVHAVELDKEMLSALDKGWRRALGLKRVSLESRDLFRRPLLLDELDRFEKEDLNFHEKIRKAYLDLAKKNSP